MYDCEKFRVVRERIRKILEIRPDLKNEMIVQAYRKMYPDNKATSETITRRAREVRDEMRIGVRDNSPQLRLL